MDQQFEHILLVHNVSSEFIVVSVQTANRVLLLLLIQRKEREVVSFNYFLQLVDHSVSVRLLSPFVEVCEIYVV